MATRRSKEVSQKRDRRKDQPHPCLTQCFQKIRDKNLGGIGEVKREKAEQQNVADGDMKLKLTEFVSVSSISQSMDVPEGSNHQL